MDEGTVVLENLPSVDWVRVSDFTDGDICVIRYPGHLSAQAMDRLRKQCHSVFGRAGVVVRVMVLEEGATLEMLRRAAAVEGDD